MDIEDVLLKKSNSILNCKFFKQDYFVYLEESYLEEDENDENEDNSDWGWGYEDYEQDNLWIE